MAMARKDRPHVLDSGPMQYAPENELGVVFLFAHLAKRWRLRIKEIKSAFPDCIAYQKVKGGEKKIRIEFEFKSKNFRNHKHRADKCDWIVCWEHNWPDAPKALNIIELRREFGLGFNVWISPANPHYGEILKKEKRIPWFSVASQAHKNDLMLFYVKRPVRALMYIYELEDRAAKRKAVWKEGLDFMAPMRKVYELKAPIFLEDLKSHRVLRTASFVRANMQGRQNAMEYWPFLYDIIIRRNPAAKSRLRRFAPEEI